MPFSSKTIELQGRRADHPAPPTNLRLLSQSHGEDTTVFRFLENGTLIKFVTVDNAAASDMRNVEFTIASTWRAGDWDSAVVRGTGCWDAYVMTQVSWTKPSARDHDNGFLQRIVAFEDLAVVDSYGPGCQLVTCPQFAGQPLIFKHQTSGQQDDPMANEAMAYGWLSHASDSLADKMPKFLGHVCLDDTIVGFLTEHVSSRHVESFNQKDDNACLQAVKDLHKHGVLHGDIGGETLQIQCDSEGKAVKFGPNREHKAVFTSFCKASKAGLAVDDSAREMGHVYDFLAQEISGVVLGKPLESDLHIEFLERDSSSNQHIEFDKRDWSSDQYDGPVGVAWKSDSEETEETVVYVDGEGWVVDDGRAEHEWC